MAQYHFITRWEVAATCEQVYRILEKAEDLPRWWPSVYLDVKIVEKGAENGIGRIVNLHTKGWLPYTLRWSFRVTAAEFPHGFAIEAFGDFVGTGVWTFRPLEKTGTGPCCEIIYDWKISAEKPLLKWFTPILRPIFSANHHWAMRQGLISLKKELGVMG